MSHNNRRDEDAGCIAWLLLAFLALAVLGAVLAILAAAGVIFLIAAAIGALLWAMWIPVRVLRGTSEIKPIIASPEYVQDSNLLGRPKGDSAALGWDPAWPNYFPYQFERELDAMKKEASHSISSMRELLFGDDPGVIRTGFGILGMVAYAPIVTIATWFTVLCLQLIARVYMLFQTIYAKSIRSKEEKRRKALCADIHCTHCHRDITMPAYICPGCGSRHNDISPGPLGLKNRICHCGLRLPVGIEAAAQSLQAVCPHCEQPLSPGSGTRRLFSIPVFGAPSAGKSMLLHSTVGHLDRYADSIELEPLGTESRNFLEESRIHVAENSTPNKTRVAVDRPAIAILAHTHEETMELRFMDAAGEQFESIDTVDDLRYMDISRNLVFVIDPLSIPDIRMQLSTEQLRSFRVADRPTNESYRAVIDRLRNSAVDLGERKLAVVVAKADAVNHLFPDNKIEPTNNGVHSWLNANGADDLTRQIKFDFGDNVTYFAVDSTDHSGENGALSPLQVAQWLAENSGGSLGIENPSINEQDLDSRSSATGSETVT